MDPIEQFKTEYRPERVSMTKDSDTDAFFYVLLCLLTLGSVWICRMIISVAIRKAVK